jgi:hypothetical protein
LKLQGIFTYIFFRSTGVEEFRSSGVTDPTPPYGHPAGTPLPSRGGAGVGSVIFLLDGKDTDI